MGKQLPTLSPTVIKKQPRIFFGWWTVLAISIASGLGHGFYSRGFSVLFKPIASELDLNRAVTSVAAGVGRLEGGLEAPLTGWVSDKFGPKWIMFAGTCIMIIGLILMNFVNSLWAFYLIWGVTIGTGLNLAFALALDKALTSWFIRKRGIVISTRFVITGISGVIVLPVVTWLVNTQGWRVSCLIWGGVMFACIPLILCFVKQRRPEYYGLLPDGAKVEPSPKADVDTTIDKGVEYAASFHETEFTLKQTMRTRAYWLLIAAWGSNMLVGGAFNIHCIPFLTDMGIDPTVAGGMMAMMVFFAIPSRLIAGFLADRIRKDRLQFLLVGSFLVQAVGIVTFLLNQTTATLYVFLILFGLGQGPPITMIIIMRSHYYGRKAFGSYQGLADLFTAPIALLAPVYAGWIYDTTGSYMTAFVVFAILAAVNALLSSLIRPPKPPAHITDARNFM